MPPTTHTPTPRTDKRYSKDPANAPAIVSERRLTFFLPENTYRALRKQTGLFQVANSEAATGTPEMPETPSAVVREAIDFWLDQFRPAADRTRSDKEWEARITELRTATKGR